MSQHYSAYVLIYRDKYFNFVLVYNFVKINIFYSCNINETVNYFKLMFYVMDV